VLVGINLETERNPKGNSRQRPRVSGSIRLASSVVDSAITEERITDLDFCHLRACGPCVTNGVFDLIHDRRARMANYKIYMRSFAPWRKFGEFKKPTTLSVPLPPAPPSPYPQSASITLGGAYEGDGRKFSLETGSPNVTSRINAVLEVDLDAGTKGYNKVWCDPSRGPWMMVGPQTSAIGTPTSELTVAKHGSSVHVVIDYAAPNPLAKAVPPVSWVVPDIDARGEYTLSPSPGSLTVTATITGDQFPACESFIVDPSLQAIFLGGFAPPNKDEVMRLYGGRFLGGLNTPKTVWFESEVVVSLDSNGNFQQLQGGGSGSNSTGPACEGITMNLGQWNLRIMGSILMPSDAP
jgi:hypothetical protein